MMSTRTSVHLDDEDRVDADIEDNYTTLDFIAADDGAQKVSIFIGSLANAVAIRDAAQRLVDHYVVVEQQALKA